MGGAQSRVVEERYEVHVVSIESPGSSEKHVRGTNTPLPFQVLLDVSRAVCKVTIENGSGTGFLAKFATTTGSLVHGLFTNNHVLSEGRLADGQAFRVTFGAIPAGTTSKLTSVARTIMTKGAFRFTCPILDATFIKFSEEDIEVLTSSGCCFLQVASDWKGEKDAPVFVFQHPGGSDIHFAQGKCLAFNGFDIFHSVSTDYGSSGSPIAISDGTIVGLHKARSVSSSQNYNIAVTMKAIIKALLPHFVGMTSPYHLVCNPIALDQAYSEKLLQIGLERCFIDCSSNYCGLMYVSPPSKFLGLEYVTPIWFVPTSHGWFWTPTDPSNQKKETNWMPVSQLQVIGGFWHGLTPAEKNVTIIKWLYQHNIVRGMCPSVH